jgi:N-acetylneuraminic acid mutarotase
MNQHTYNGPRGSIAFLVYVAAFSITTATLLGFFRGEMSAKDSQRTLTFEERLAHQRAIEEVYWRHRIWPQERPDPKPSLDAVMPQAQLEKKVVDYLRNSQALEDYWQRPIAAEQLQTEMDRMARHTKQPEVLRELFEALGNDPFVIAECLARPVLTERLVTKFYAHDREPFASSRAREKNQTAGLREARATSYVLPEIAGGGCANDTWTATSTTNAPEARASHTAVWTGSEMIVWGGTDDTKVLNTGGRYDPTTDSWTITSTINAPDAREFHTTVWSGSEMVVWGGIDVNSNDLNTGGKYNPGTDTWMATTTTNAPDPRRGHTAVWTGSEMIVWGGAVPPHGRLNTGGRYNPSTNTWTATSTTNAPEARASHTAVWTGSQMIVWGGTGAQLFEVLNTGGRYNPSTDSWTATSLNNVPQARFLHTAVWTGNEMILWGGHLGVVLNTGGRYNPSTDSWTATSLTNAPSARTGHTAVWTASEMIVWGGTDSISNIFNTGGRYNPSSNSWIATSTTNAPSARSGHTAVWTGSEMIEMIVWGGGGAGGFVNTGGRYCAQAGLTPTPTPTATATPTSTPTPSGTPTVTPTATPTATPRVTPRPRPTPHPRPTPPG